MALRSACLKLICILFVNILLSSELLLTVNSAPTEPSTRWIKPKKPLILVGGLGGNKLYELTSTGKPNYQLWINSTDFEQVANDQLSNTYTFRNTFNSWSGLQQHTGPSKESHGLEELAYLNENHLDRGEEQFALFDTLIEHLVDLGYVKGTTLFAFPYDWRDSLTDEKTNIRFLKLITKISRIYGKVDIISHYTGGLKVLSLFAAHFDTMDMLVDTWIAIGTPWHGIPTSLIQMISGYTSLLYPNANDTLSKFDISNHTLHNLAMNWPVSYELLPNFHNDWKDLHKITPTVCYYERDTSRRCVNNFSQLQELLINVNSHNTITISGQKYPATFNRNAWSRGIATQELLATLQDKLLKNSKNHKFFNILGDENATPILIDYTELITAYSDLIKQTPSIKYTNRGDGYVPISLPSSVFKSIYYRGKMGNTELLKSKPVLRAVKSLLGLSCKPLGCWQYTDSGSFKEFYIAPDVQILPLNPLIDDEPASTRDTLVLGNITGYFDDHCTELSFSIAGGNQSFLAHRMPNNTCTENELREAPFENGFSYYACMFNQWDTSEVVNQTCHPLYILTSPFTCTRAFDDRWSFSEYYSVYVIALGSICIFCLFVLNVKSMFKLSGPSAPRGDFDEN